ncbi:MAG: asparagine synthase-related protein [Candidatus Hermodarchaeota archaeon]|nr:asparagine synthase-related protein [Candidatus Hermodarchaeota archaeon]
MANEDLTEAFEEFKFLLTNAINSTYNSSASAGLLFSGGLDSSILAVMLAKIHPTTFHLFVSGTELALDIERSRLVADTLKLPLIIRQFTQDDVREVLPEILSLVTVVDVLQVELALPLYLATKCAYQFDMEVLFSGQGADELFGGYARHERHFVQSGEEATLIEMQRDLQKLHEETLPSHCAIVNHFGIELLTPFLSDSLVHFVLDLPFDSKIISTPEGVIRKRFLRLFAQYIGVPKDVANAPKRAMQYGSGAHRLLCNLSQEFWLEKDPSLSLRQARSHPRMQEYLMQLKHNESQG